MLVPMAWKPAPTLGVTVLCTWQPPELQCRGSVWNRVLRYTQWKLTFQMLTLSGVPWLWGKMNKIWVVFIPCTIILLKKECSGNYLHCISHRKDFLYIFLLSNEIFGISFVFVFGFFFRLQKLPKYILLENVKGFEVSSTR